MNEKSNTMTMYNCLVSEKLSNGALGLLLVMLCFAGSTYGQDEKEQKKLIKESQEYLSKASENIEENNFPRAEAEYRNAIALVPTDETGQYNLGNAYYKSTLNTEAMRRFIEAANVATTKPEKHKAYHNLGNTFMNSKQYAEAVEAYKNALRSNPTDEETRYNLALAKKMLEDNPKDGGGDGEDKEQDKKENKQDQENKEDQGKDKEGDEKEKKDQGDQKDENKDGENKENAKPDENKKGENEKPQQQQPVPGQLSPQQIQNLLEAMNNEEKKVQDKINAKKQKGTKVKPEKDW